MEVMAKKGETIKGFSKSNLAREYRDKYGMDVPTLTLARKMYNDNKSVFSSIDAARTMLRAIEGKGKTGILKTHLMEEDRPKNPFNLPESYKADREPFTLPVGCNNILVLSDLHIPYHDSQSIEIAFNYGLKNNCNTIFINGDLIDFHGCSKFEKDPRKRSLKQEFEAAKQFNVALRAAFPNAHIYWLKGNHDMRYERWLMTKVLEVFDDPYYQLENRLALNQERIHLIDDKVLVKMGKLNVTHGHHLVKGVFAPVNPARGVYMKAKKSTLIGHLHRSSKQTEIDIDGNVTMCFSTGCLCELRPDYNPLASNSMHGFAHVETFEGGTFDVKLCDIINGRVV